MSLLGRSKRANTASSEATQASQYAAPAYSSSPIPSAVPPPIPQSNGTASPDSPRRSFTFLRRSKSSEPPGTGSGGGSKRSASGGKLVSHRKQKALAKEEQIRQQREAANKIPRIPSYQTLPRISAPFTSQSTPSDSYDITPNRAGGYNPSAFYQRHGMEAPKYQQAGHIPVPPIPESSSPPQTADGRPSLDPFSRTQSMTHRGRYSYASSAISTIDSPRRIRRRKDPTPFNILVVGAKGCGKTSFIEFLRTSLTLPFRKRPLTPTPHFPPSTQSDANSPFTSHYIETEMDGERIGLTLYDSKGLERHVVDLQLRELSSFVESKFQETFAEEQKVVRAAGVLDPHIHCVFLLLDPSRLDANLASISSNVSESRSSPYARKPQIIGGLDENLDIEVIRILQGKTIVVPVISKADTVTTAHMTYLKRIVWDSLKKVKINPLESLNQEVDSDSEEARTPVDNRFNVETLRSVPEKNGNGDHAADPQGSIADQSIDYGTPPETPTADTYKAPQHPEVRYSALSDNVDLPDLPLSIISPDVYDPGTVGRRFPWGFSDPYNPEHCDFVRLKDSVFSEWRADLRVASREKWYEGWRTSRLKQRSAAPTPIPTSNMPDGYRTTSAQYASKQPNGVSRIPNNDIGVAVAEGSPPRGNYASGIAY